MFAASDLLTKNATVPVNYTFTFDIQYMRHVNITNGGKNVGWKINFIHPPYNNLQCNSILLFVKISFKIICFLSKIIYTTHFVKYK